MKVWHGTFSQRGQYLDFSNHRGFISFSLDRDHARSYAMGVHQECWEDGSRLFEVQLCNLNTLDYSNSNHVDLIKVYLEEISFDHFPKETWDESIRFCGAYQCLEHRDLLERNGFDSVYTCESGWKNIHVLNHESIEIIKIHYSDPGSKGLSDKFGNRIFS